MNKYLLIFIFLFAFSCTQTIQIEGFDPLTWKNDTDGCKKERKDQVDLLISNKNQLLGKDQDQIKKLLGRPDMHEIYRRAQRFYIYSLDPGASCENYNADTLQANLTLRFNALGRVHEVVYYK